MLNNKEKGFTLLELLISVFILTVGILGAYVAIQKSATIANYSYNRLTAAYLAQEGIEIIRNIKDTNLLEGLAGENDWDEGLVSNDYEIEYADSQNPDPNLMRTCPLPCDFNDLNPLRRDDSFYSYGATNETKFKRKVSVEVGIDFINITATVYWQDGTKIREFKVWDKFYNWL